LLFSAAQLDLYEEIDTPIKKISERLSLLVGRKVFFGTITVGMLTELYVSPITILDPGLVYTPNTRLDTFH